MTDESYPPPCRNYLQPLYLSVTLYACAQRYDVNSNQFRHILVVLGSTFKACSIFKCVVLIPQTLIVVSFVQAIVSRYFSESFTFVYSAKWNTSGMHHMTVTIFKLENAQMGDSGTRIHNLEICSTVNYHLSYPGIDHSCAIKVSFIHTCTSDTMYTLV